MVPLQFSATSPLPHPLINPDGNSRSTPAPPTTQSPSHPAHTDYQRGGPFGQGMLRLLLMLLTFLLHLRYATAGAPSNDDGLIRDEDYVPPPSPNTGSHPGSVSAGQHGRFCFCF
ncbi:hypothetical protein BDR07DRAFT_1374284 [Suillus spraguei]|nr:hypothetical protein BDR07DRAFT_1374284 [Suillus spraguei]